MDTSRIVESLRQRGLAILDPMPMAKFAEFSSYLLSLPVYLDAHVPETARRNGRHPVPRAISGSSECVCVETDKIIAAPHFLEVALELTNVAARYLNCDPPVGYSMNAFWTRPGASVRPDIQEFHIDQDDVRFLVLFVYLNDVLNLEDGAQDLDGPDNVRRSITGPRGTMFLADTSRMHRGRKPATGERGLAWFRWGVSPTPPAYLWDKNGPIPASALGSRFPEDPRLRETIRLIAR